MKTRVTLAQNAKIPTKAHNGDIGWDLYSSENMVLEPLKVTKVNTGIAIQADQETISEGYLEKNGLQLNRNIEKTFYTKIEGRSGLASKGVFPVGGIIDKGYTGPLMVCLANLSSEAYNIKIGDKIAQLVYYNTNLEVHFEKVETFEVTSRGEGGFGSSGR